ncbi:MAG: hypothetical protein MUO68_04350, partial [Desulfobacteraceae bacterium]|nr:hypothetical protein [Desulfobacteraceae bacterium]
KILSELFKRVSFSSFGIETTDFQKRRIVAYALGTLGASGIAERIWARYDRFTLAKKTEIPQILAALGDPRLTEHLVGIINRCEDHQLMMATMETLAKGGNAEAVPFLRSKIIEWEAKAAETSLRIDAGTGMDYFVLSRKAAQVIPKIEERLSLEKGQPALREKQGEEKKGTKPIYF